MMVYEKAETCRWDKLCKHSSVIWTLQVVFDCNSTYIRDPIQHNGGGWPETYQVFLFLQTAPNHSYAVNTLWYQKAVF